LRVSEIVLKKATLYFIHADNQLQHLASPRSLVNIRIWNRQSPVAKYICCIHNFDITSYFIFAVSFVL